MASDKSLPEVFWTVTSGWLQQVASPTSWALDQLLLMTVALPGECLGLESVVPGEAHTHGSPQVPKGWAHRGRARYKTDVHPVWR